MLTFVHYKILKGFNKDWAAEMILIEHQKAFETIYHNILLKN